MSRSEFPLMVRSAALVAFLGATLSGGCGTGSKEPLPPSAKCNSDPVFVMEPNAVSSISENLDETCASVVGTLDWKMGATGSACTSPLDCSPVCCVCPGGARHALTTWCDHGVCAPGEAACCMMLGTSLRSCTD